MTRELAIECIKTQKQFVDDMTKEAFDKAIEALREISILAKPSNKVEVVRCRDCKHTIVRPDGEIYCEKLDMEEIPVSHFCGWGERKGGDDDDY